MCVSVRKVVRSVGETVCVLLSMGDIASGSLAASLVPADVRVCVCGVE